MSGQIINGVERWLTLRRVKQHPLKEAAEGVAMYGIGAGRHQQGSGLHGATLTGAQSLGAAGDEVKAADRVVENLLHIFFTGHGSVENGAAQGSDLFNLHTFFKADMLVGVGKSF